MQSRRMINLRHKRRLEKQPKASPATEHGEETPLEDPASASAEVDQGGQGDEVAPNSPSPTGEQSGEEAEHGSTE